MSHFAAACVTQVTVPTTNASAMATGLLSAGLCFLWLWLMNMIVKSRFLDATSIAILLPSTVLAALITMVAFKKGFFAWQSEVKPSVPILIAIAQIAIILAVPVLSSAILHLYPVLIGCEPRSPGLNSYLDICLISVVVFALELLLYRIVRYERNGIPGHAGALFNTLMIAWILSWIFPFIQFFRLHHSFGAAIDDFQLIREQTRIFGAMSTLFAILPGIAVHWNERANRLLCVASIAISIGAVVLSILLTAQRTLLSAIVFGDLGLHKQCIGACDDYLKHDPNSAFVYYLRGLAFADTRCPDKALSDYARAITLESKGHSRMKVHIARASLYDRLGQDTKAILDWNSAVRLFSDYGRAEDLRQIALGRSRCYTRLGRFDRAIDDASFLIGIHPASASAYSARASAYNGCGKYWNAVIDCFTALSLDPQCADAFNNRGYARMRLGAPLLNDALRDFNAAIDIDPEFTEAITNREKLHNNLSSLKSK